MSSLPLLLWRNVEIWAALLYLSLTMAMGFATVGLQHDECLHLHGSVQMLRWSEPPPLIVSAEAWVEIGGRSWPLMVTPYAGAIKNYIMVGPFALFGPQPFVARAVAALLGATGIWGIARSVRRWAGPWTAAAATVPLAIHPAYVTHSLYDNGTVGVWFALFGLLAVGIERYGRMPSPATALLLGVLTGLGIWTRANFVWLAVSLSVGIAVATWGRLRLTLSSIGAFVFGGIIGGAPFLLYQIHSGFIIFSTMRDFRSDSGLLERVRQTLPRVLDTMLLNVENRSIWGGPPGPLWPRLVVFLVLSFGAGACLLPWRTEDGKHSALRRASVIALLTFGAIMLTSRTPVYQHHLVTALPLAFVSAALGFSRLWTRARRLRGVLAGAAVVTLGLFLASDIQNVRGLRATRGYGFWSIAINDVAQELLARSPGRFVQVLDWGFANNLFVLSRGEVTAREIFFGADRRQAANGDRWDSVVAKGGLFLAGAGANVQFPDPAAGFRDALVRSGARRHSTLFRQADGNPYAELFDVELQGPPSGVPIVHFVTPASTRVGEGFQLQPDGSSALSVVGEAFGPDCVVVLAGQALPTVVGGPGWVTAVVPRERFSRPGRLEVRVVDPERGSSAAVFFEVHP